MDEGEPGVDLERAYLSLLRSAGAPVPRCEHRHRDVSPAHAALGVPHLDPDITVVRADTGAAVLTLVVQGRVEFTAADFVL